MSVSSFRNYSQISLSGIPEDITAEQLKEFLDHHFGTVTRSKMKGYLRKNSRGDHIIERYGYGYVEFAATTVAAHMYEMVKEGKFLIRSQKLKAWTGRSMHLFNERYHKVLRRATLETGFLASTRRMKVGWRSAKSSVRVEFDFQQSKLNIFLCGENPKTCPRKLECRCMTKDHRLEFSLRNVRAYQNRVDREDRCLSLFLEVSSPPRISFRSADDDLWELYESNWWSSDDGDPWTRTTHLEGNAFLSISNVYHILLPFSELVTWEEISAHLAKYWWVDSSIAHESLKKEELTVDDIGFQIHPFFSLHRNGILAYESLFLLNALITRWIVPATKITERFLQFVSLTESNICRDALTKMVSYFRPTLDPLHRFKIEMRKLAMGRPVKRAKQEAMAVSDNFIKIHRLIITPGSAYCIPPEYELCNRVLRHYRHLSSRFLRVVFMEEGPFDLNAQTLLVQYGLPAREGHRARGGEYTTIYYRILQILKDGFSLCGLRFRFLASSTNQLRDKSAWFIAEDPSIDFTVAHVRHWMGDFSHITNTAKCAARIGLFFSSSHLSVHLPRHQVEEVPDIVSAQGSLMTDGIGKMTPELAAELAEGLALRSSHVRGVPSAYQIRYAGYKGMLAVWPVPAGSSSRVFFRPSMRKFPSAHEKLEVLEWARFLPGFLNRQIIVLLSALKVPDKIFIQMQDKMLRHLDNALESRQGAKKLVDSGCFEDLHDTVQLMLSAGLEPKRDPHLRGMLQAVRALQLQELLSKARIFVPKSRWMLGTVDETGLLNHGECFLQVSGPIHDYTPSEKKTLSEESRSSTHIITGLICFGKNPCLHPGDLRFLTAVDYPELHGQVDTIVLPSTGPRSHANEASGSDMDGDVYFVHWDPYLIPTGGKSWEPMDYEASSAKDDGNVSQEMIAEFFVSHMLNENLGMICNAHVVHADLSPIGALDDKCMRLAHQAAIAVDFGKTGIPGQMPRDLKPDRYPDFMEKDERISYRSEKVLGVLYRKVKTKVDFEELEESRKRGPRVRVPDGVNLPHCCPSVEEVWVAYDPRFRVPGFEAFLEEAYLLKLKYNKHLWVIMEQYGVLTEGEVVTGQIVHLSRHIRRRQGQTKERIKHLYLELRRWFREEFLSLCKEQDDKIPAAMVPTSHSHSSRNLPPKLTLVEVMEPTDELTAGGHRSASPGAALTAGRDHLENAVDLSTAGGGESGNGTAILPAGSGRSRTHTTDSTAGSDYSRNGAAVLPAGSNHLRNGAAGRNLREHDVDHLTAGIDGLPRENAHLTAGNGTSACDATGSTAGNNNVTVGNADLAAGIALSIPTDLKVDRKKMTAGSNNHSTDSSLTAGSNIHTTDSSVTAGIDCGRVNGPGSTDDSLALGSKENSVNSDGPIFEERGIVNFDVGREEKHIEEQNGVLTLTLTLKLDDSLSLGDVATHPSKLIVPFQNAKEGIQTCQLSSVEPPSHPRQAVAPSESESALIGEDEMKAAMASLKAQKKPSQFQKGQLIGSGLPARESTAAKPAVKILKPTAVQMARAYAWYHVTYHLEYLRRDMEFQVSQSEEYHGPEQGMLISFAWINSDVLSAIRSRAGVNGDWRAGKV